MFEQEQRSWQQISREAAERHAIMAAITARRAEAKRERHQQRRAVRRARSSSAAEAA